MGTYAGAARRRFTLRRYFFTGIRLAIAQADAVPTIPISF